MKYLVPTIGIIALGCLPSFGQITETERTAETSRDGSVTTTRVVTFNPETQTHVVKYFDTYKSQRFGLPPEWVTSMRVSDIPAEWRTARLAPGTAITDTQRAYLHAAPADLINVLPAAPSGVKYYVAGSNVIALDANFRVIDSIHIPSIKFVE